MFGTCCKSGARIFSFSPQNNILRWLSLSHFNDKETDTEKLSNFFRIIQLISFRAVIQTSFSLAQNPLLWSTKLCTIYMEAFKSLLNGNIMHVVSILQYNSKIFQSLPKTKPAIQRCAQQVRLMWMLSY